MAMDYDTALLTGAQVVSQTGHQGLANLATAGELSLDTFVLAAHRKVYRKLKGAAVDPTAITNEDELKDAVAYEAVGRLALAGYLDRDTAGEFFERVKDEIRDFKPQYSDSATGVPRKAGEGIPAVGHVSDGLVYGVGDGRGTDYMRSNLPEDLDA